MRTRLFDVKRLGKCAAFLASAFLILAAVAHADSVVYNSFGPGMTTNGIGGEGPPGGTLFLGAPFTPSTSVDLTSLTGSWGGSTHTDTPGTSTITVSLWTNSAGDPGSLLESWSLVIAEASANYTLTSVPGILLAAGSTYWVVEGYTGAMPGDNNLDWLTYSGATTQGLWGSQTSATSLELFGGAGNPALEVQGSPVSGAAVPEPSSLLLLGTGLVGIVLLSRKWRGTSSHTHSMG